MGVTRILAKHPRTGFGVLLPAHLFACGVGDGRNRAGRPQIVERKV